MDMFSKREIQEIVSAAVDAALAVAPVTQEELDANFFGDLLTPEQATETGRIQASQAAMYAKMKEIKARDIAA